MNNDKPLISFETDKLTVKAVANNIIKYIYGEN